MTARCAACHAAHQLMDYFNKAVHATSMAVRTELDQMLAQAKTAAVPPDGFTIASANDAGAERSRCTERPHRLGPGIQDLVHH